MFHIDAQFEDSRIIASSRDGASYDVEISDNLTGNLRKVKLTPLQLSYIMAINFDNDGEPEGVVDMYAELEPIFKDWPNHLRPIP